jgi:DNA-binding MarR family transcriptional regulator
LHSANIAYVKRLDPQTSPAGPRADVAAFERLTQALVGITVQSLDALDSAVTVAQFRLLRTLDGLGRVSCSTLATALGSAASSVTRLVDKLETAGLVARGSDPHSRSIVTVETTEAGREVVRGGARAPPRPARGSARRDDPGRAGARRRHRRAVRPARRGRGHGRDQEPGGPVTPRSETVTGDAAGRRTAPDPAPPTAEPPPLPRPRHLGDFTLDARVLPITGLALVVGAAGAGAAFCLLRLIGLITNLVFYQRVSTALVAPGAMHHDPALVLLAPIAGGLVVGSDGPVRLGEDPRARHAGGDRGDPDRR